MSSLEEVDIMRQQTIKGMNAFYNSLKGNHDPVQIAARIQGKITELIEYIQVIEEYVNDLPCTPKNRSDLKNVLICPLRSSEQTSKEGIL